jgi:hypothetical protein
MIIILWAFGIFLLQSRYDFGPQAVTRSAAEQRGSPLYTDGGTGGRRLATSIIDAPHASVNDESGARSDRPGSWRPDDATANTLVLQDGRIRIRTLVYTVQAVMCTDANPVRSADRDLVASAATEA